MKTSKKLLAATLFSVLTAPLSGCAGDVLYSRDLPEVRAAAKLWTDLGMPLTIAYTDPPPHADVIRFVRGGLGDVGALCVAGETGRPNPFELHEVTVDLGCVDSGTVPLQDVVAHEMGHWIGMHAHLPEPEEGIMAPNGYDETATAHEVHPLSCSDVRGMCTFMGCSAREYCAEHGAP